MSIHFDHSITKITKDGDSVLSSYLDEGEKLSNGTSYADVKKDIEGVLRGTATLVDTKEQDFSADADRDDQKAEKTDNTLNTDEPGQLTDEEKKQAEDDAAKKAAEDEAEQKKADAAKAASEKKAAGSK